MFTRPTARSIERERLLSGDLPELSVRILELCRERGCVSISDIAKITSVSRNTIKDHVTALTAKGHLVRHGSGRGAWYALDAFIQVTSLFVYEQPMQHVRRADCAILSAPLAH